MDGILVENNEMEKETNRASDCSAVRSGRSILLGIYTAIKFWWEIELASYVAAGDWL